MIFSDFDENSIAVDTIRWLTEGIHRSIAGKSHEEKIRVFLRNVLEGLYREGCSRYHPRMYEREAEALDLSVAIVRSAAVQFEAAYSSADHEAAITTILDNLLKIYSQRYRPEPPVITAWRDMMERTDSRYRCLEARPFARLEERFR